MNYLLKAHSHNPIYHEMQMLSIASYRKFLAGDFAVIMVDFEHSETLMPGDWKDFSMWQKIIAEGFWLTYTLWKDGHNCFTTGADTLCLRPTEVFGSTDQMRMYWGESSGYLMGDVIYFPAGMSQKCWDRGLQEINDLRNDWGHIQDIYNEMFRVQEPRPELDPSMHYAPDIHSNPCSESEAHIRHFHATKGAESVLQRMRDISRRWE